MKKGEIVRREKAVQMCKERVRSEPQPIQVTEPDTEQRAPFADSSPQKDEAESYKFTSTRNIVELTILSECLDVKGCKVCKQPLQLCKTKHEQRYGLGLLLYIECVCGALNAVPTGKRHFDSGVKKTMPLFDINSKLTAGMYEHPKARKTFRFILTLISFKLINNMNITPSPLKHMPPSLGNVVIKACLAIFPNSQRNRLLNKTLIIALINVSYICLLRYRTCILW